MINIILSGNFAFLNHVTIIPALACLDDACYPTWLRRYVCRSRQVRPFAHSELRRRPKMILRWSVDACLVVLIGMLSVPVVTNLLQMGGKHQMMNASFNSFRLVNTYGAFGSVGEARYEPIISVSSDGQIWSEIELPCKPGSVNRRPCFSAPYHYRYVHFVTKELNLVQIRSLFAADLIGTSGSLASNLTNRCCNDESAGCTSWSTRFSRAIRRQPMIQSLGSHCWMQVR